MMLRAGVTSLMCESRRTVQRSRIVAAVARVSLMPEVAQYTLTTCHRMSGRAIRHNCREPETVIILQQYISKRLSNLGIFITEFFFISHIIGELNVYNLNSRWKLFI